MAIGNAPWPIGVTMVGIHARTGREKIFSKHVAHVLNDETQRKYIQVSQWVPTVVCHFKKNLFLTAKSWSAVNVGSVLCDLLPLVCSSQNLPWNFLSFLFFYFSLLSRLLRSLNHIYCCCYENVMSPPSGPESNYTTVQRFWPIAIPRQRLSFWWTLQHSWNVSAHLHFHCLIFIRASLMHMNVVLQPHAFT